MSLSVASSVASHGQFLGYGLAGLSTVTATNADAPQRPGVAPSWSWTPNSTGSGSRNTQVANLMAVLWQIPVPNPDARSESTSDIVIPQNDAKDLLTSLNKSATATAPAAASASATSQQIDRLPSPDLSQATPSDGAVVTSGEATSQDPSSADGLGGIAEVKLEALFKTLQAYGL